MAETDGGATGAGASASGGEQGAVGSTQVHPLPGRYELDDEHSVMPSCPHCYHVTTVILLPLMSNRREIAGDFPKIG